MGPGSSALDRTGELRREISALLEDDPELSFAEVALRLPADWDDHRFFAIDHAISRLPSPGRPRSSSRASTTAFWSPTGTTFRSLPISPILGTSSPRRPSRRLSSRSRPGPTTTSASAGGTPTGGSPRRSTPPSAITAPSASDAGRRRSGSAAGSPSPRPSWSADRAPRRRGRPRVLPAASLSSKKRRLSSTAVCGIGGAVSLSRGPVPQLQPALARDERPDQPSRARRPGDLGASTTSTSASPTGASPSSTSRRGDQPMTDGAGNWITYNGEIYNYLELRAGARRARASAPTPTPR